MSGLGALAQFDLDHLDLWVTGVGGKLVGVECAVVVAAAKVARRHLPDQITTVLAVVYRDRAFAGVMRKATALGARVERLDGIGTKGTKTHRRDIEHAAAVRLGPVTTDDDAEVVRGQLGGDQRMVDPFIALGVHIKLRAKRTLVGVTFGALVNQRALGAREGVGLGVAFDEVLADFWAHKFQHKTQMANDGVVA